MIDKAGFVRYIIVMNKTRPSYANPFSILKDQKPNESWESSLEDIPDEMPFQDVLKRTSMETKEQNEEYCILFENKLFFSGEKKECLSKCLDLLMEGYSFDKILVFKRIKLFIDFTE